MGDWAEGLCLHLFCASMVHPRLAPKNTYTAFGLRLIGELSQVEQ